MFRNLMNIFSIFIFGSIELSSFYFAIYFLNVTQNYVKQASNNIYVQDLRVNSKSASTKRGNIPWKRSKNRQRDIVIRRLINRDLKNN